MKRTHLALALLLSFVSSTAFAQKKFVLMSFNALHYGWGGQDATANKDDAIAKAANDFDAHAVVLQEVMPQATFGNLQKQFPPGTAEIILSSQSYGNGKYSERYLIILRKDKFPGGAIHILEYPNMASSHGGPFSRPPMLVEVKPQGSNKTYYIGDFHAIWGRRQSQRTEEAKAICTVLRPKVGSWDIALAGDWNLTAQQVRTSAQCLAEVGPTGLTTLNRDGTAYSSSYDHGVQFQNSNLKFEKALVYPLPIQTTTWRQFVSDHVPVAVQYSYE